MDYETEKQAVEMLRAGRARIDAELSKAIVGQAEVVEQLLISLQATPSFAAFGRFLEVANPFQVWASLMQMAWLPWLTAFSGAPMARGLGELPAAGAAPRLPADKR